jgi:AcrR family transcriptional regulator
LERLSMRALARELGISPMAMYRHVKNKDDLLDGLLDRLLAEMKLPAESDPWRDRLRFMATELRGLARRHPQLFVLLLQRPAVGSDAVRTRDAVERALRDAGIDAEEAARLQRLLSTVVIGFALSEVSGRFAGLDTDREFAAAVDLLLESVAA